MTFYVQCKAASERPKFADVVEMIWADYKRFRGNIVGKTLNAPPGTTGRQMSLALTRVHVRWTEMKLRKSIKNALSSQPSKRRTKAMKRLKWR